MSRRGKMTGVLNRTTNQLISKKPDPPALSVAASTFVPSLEQPLLQLGRSRRESVLLSEFAGVGGGNQRNSRAKGGEKHGHAASPPAKGGGNQRNSASPPAKGGGNQRNSASPPAKGGGKQGDPKSPPPEAGGKVQQPSPSAQDDKALSSAHASRASSVDVSDREGANTPSVSSTPASPRGHLDASSVLIDTAKGANMEQDASLLLKQAQENRDLFEKHYNRTNLELLDTKSRYAVLEAKSSESSKENLRLTALVEEERKAHEKKTATDNELYMKHQKEQAEQHGNELAQKDIDRTDAVSVLKAEMFSAAQKAADDLRVQTAMVKSLQKQISDGVSVVSDEVVTLTGKLEIALAAAKVANTEATEKIKILEATLAAKQLELNALALSTTNEKKDTHDQIEKLGQLQLAVTEENKKLQADIAVLAQSVHAGLADKAQLQAEIAMLKAFQANNAEGVKIAEENQIVLLQKAVFEANETIASLSSECTEADNAQALANNECLKVNANLAEHVLRLAVSDSKIVQLSDELAAANQKLASPVPNAEIASLQEQLKVAQRQLEEAQAQATADRAKTKLEHEETKAKLGEANKQVEKLTSELLAKSNELEKALAGFASQLEALQVQIVPLEGGVNPAMAILQAQVDALQGQLVGMRTAQLAESKEKTAALEQELQATKALVVAKGVELHELEMKLVLETQKLSQQTEAAASSTERTILEIQVLTSEKTSLNARIVALEANVDVLTKAQTAASVELGQEQAKLISANGLLQQANITLGDVRNQFAVKNTEFTTLQSENTNLKQEKVRNTEQIKQLTENNATLTEEGVILTAKVLSLTEEHARTTAWRKEATKKFEHCNNARIQAIIDIKEAGYKRQLVGMCLPE